MSTDETKFVEFKANTPDVINYGALKGLLAKLELYISAPNSQEMLADRFKDNCPILMAMPVPASTASAFKALLLSANDFCQGLLEQVAGERN